MNIVTKGYEPASMLGYFEDISAIPRGSGNESGVADYLCDFAKKNGLEYYRDELHNVMIRRPADVGCEDIPSISLQGHTDMVCDKENSTEHDFMKDPLKLYIDNGFLRAKGTTLGGDDGAAVAAMLALLDGTSGVLLPELECVFTTQEETGLGGALGFNWGLLKSRKMINLDSEQEGEAVVGCCGGERCYSVFKADRIAADKKFIRIELSGLSGGHSGTDIDRGRANANILAGSLISRLAEECSAQLSYIDGGSKDNAIARECAIELACSGNYHSCISKFEADVCARLCKEDSAFAVKTQDIDGNSALSCEDTRCVADFISGLPNGVISMCRGLDLPQTSSNLGVIRTEGNAIWFDISVRSSVADELDSVCEQICALAEKNHMNCDRNSRYPGWERRDASEMEKLFRQCYTELFGGEVSVVVIHAGLECGIISGALPDMDIISIGPTMHDIHSPAEALDLASCERFWRLLCKMLSCK